MTPWDGLAWALMSPPLVLSLALIPGGRHLVGRFSEAYTSLAVELPVATRTVIAIGDPWVFLVLAGVVAVGVAALLRVRHPGLRVGLGIGCALAALAWVQLVIAAIGLPLLELQKQLQ